MEAGNFIRDPVTYSVFEIIFRDSQCLWLRGLPVVIDKAIRLPGEHLIQAEQEDAHVRLERTTSRSRS